MRLRVPFLIVLTATTLRVYGADVYGSAVTAQTIALGGIYLGSTGPTDALASDPALLTSIGRPVCELTGMGVLAGGQFHNATPFVGSLESNVGFTGSAGCGLQIPNTRVSVGIGTFPVSLLSDRWRLDDPKGTAGASYGIQSEKSAFLALQSSFGVGVQVSQGLSLGAAMGIIDNMNTLEMPYVFQQNSTLAGLKTLLNLHTQGVGYNGTFGLVASPVHHLQFGLNYKTRTTVRSTGNASGNASSQFAVLGLSNDPVFHYKAQVDNVFPQMASVSLAWQAHSRIKTYLQGDWLDWRGAFVRLPVHLTQGNNQLINSLLESTSLNDSVPLNWRNQFNIRTGFELSMRESLTLQGGFAEGNSPVPASTLTPLTAAIMTRTFSTGLAYRKARYQLQLAYQLNPPETAHVGTSALLAGEFDDTRTSVWLQTIALTTAVRF